MNPTDEARLDWDEGGPDENDVLADNEVLATENARLNAEVDRLDRLVGKLRAERDEAVGAVRDLVDNYDATDEQAFEAAHERACRVIAGAS